MINASFNLSIVVCLDLPAGGVAVGGVGAGKTETVKGLARAAGQYLATLTCTADTPAQVPDLGGECQGR